MNNRKDIQEELAGMNSMLADVSQVMPYAVPENYFTSFAGKIQDILCAADKEEVKDWSKKMPYAMPKGYFEKLPEQIVNTVAIAEKKDIPEGYFDTLAERVLEAAKASDKQGRRIPMPARVFAQLRWAAAAVLIMCVGIGGYMVFNNQPSSRAEKMLSTIPPAEIQEYLQTMDRMDAEPLANNATINTLQLDNKEIVSYLNETGWE